MQIAEWAFANYALVNFISWVIDSQIDKDFCLRMSFFEQMTAKHWCLVDGVWIFRYYPYWDYGIHWVQHEECVIAGLFPAQTPSKAKGPLIFPSHL